MPGQLEQHQPDINVDTQSLLSIITKPSGTKELAKHSFSNSICIFTSLGRNMLVDSLYCSDIGTTSGNRRCMNYLEVLCKNYREYETIANQCMFINDKIINIVGDMIVRLSVENPTSDFANALDNVKNHHTLPLSWDIRKGIEHLGDVLFTVTSYCADINERHKNVIMGALTDEYEKSLSPLKQIVINLTGNEIWSSAVKARVLFINREMAITFRMYPGIPVYDGNSFRIDNFISLASFVIPLTNSIDDIVQKTAISRFGTILIPRA